MLVASWHLILAPFAFAQSAITLDMVLRAPDLSNIVNGATRVARIRVTAVSPQYLNDTEIGAGAPICGYLLTAKVIESFRGSTRPFQFFVPVASDFQGVNRDYFVISYSHSDRISDELRSATKLFEDKMVPLLNREECLLANSSYVAGSFQTLWVFDREAQDNSQDEWLSAATRPDGLFCGNQAKDVFTKAVEIR